MDPAVFSALGEPNRLRIVELLGVAPRPVGEIAAELGLRQPQTTKHLQTLQRAGLVTMHPLGQRRIYALRRDPFGKLREWSQGLVAEHSSEAALARYAEAIKTENALAKNDPDWPAGRTLAFTREVGASPETVWSWWTDAELLRRWWSPEHFEVVECEVDARVDGRLAIVMQEGGGTRHSSVGRFLELAAPRHLRFELGPLADDGTRLLTALHDLRLEGHRKRTTLSLAIEITAATRAAVPAVAGTQLGWEQLLEKLVQVLERRDG
jgi:uncharacterized protein YndB with AHSA1/START domain/DNA-binding transcriptional ArsR family regulator